MAPRPLQALGPHVSPLGVLYWPAPAPGQPRAWPAEYDNSVFIAEHGWVPVRWCAARFVAGFEAAMAKAVHQRQGFQCSGRNPAMPCPPCSCSSWNRTPSLGYRIANLQLAADGRTVTDHSVFADGWAEPFLLVCWLWTAGGEGSCGLPASSGLHVC